jgi:hypothetical protein
VPGPPNQAKLQLIFSKFDQNLNLIPLPPPNVRKIAILAPPLPREIPPGWELEWVEDDE